MFKIKNAFREWYQPQSSFVVRSPLFPIEKFFNWKADDETDIEESKETLRKSLREFYLQPIAQEALYIGSPDLYEQFKLWLDDKIEKKDKKEKTELSLVKYMIRMCTRCTPYGLFASCSTGNFSDPMAIGSTHIALSAAKDIQRHGRLDMDYVCELYSHLINQKEIACQLAFFPNTSLYRLGDQWRYIEHRFNKETGRSYHLVEIDESPYLGKILNASRSGEKPGELASLIIDDDISSEEAIDFIYELIQSQVLVSELEPVVTGEEYFSVLLGKLKTLHHTEKYIVMLERVAGLFKQLKEENFEDKNQIYKQIVEELQQSEVPVHLKTLIQVDSYRPAQPVSLNVKVNEELLKGMSLLQLLTPENPVKDPFADFKTAFINRYENEWMPLAEVLDTESGIGYGKFASSGMEESPLIDKLPIGNGLAEPATTSFYDTETFKWQLYQQAITEDKTAVQIDDKLIEQLSSKKINRSGLPDSICTMAKINASSSAEIDKGNYTITLQPPSGPSGANLLGRFCYLHPEIKRLTLDILENEEAHHPDRLFAEIVHLPESRIGNILMRPVLRKYEIPYLCGTSINSEFQIPITDLLVGIDNNRVILRSKKLNKEIVPRLTTAHNHHLTTLPVYQFLCDLQFQGIRQVGWQWGVLETRPFLPRVSYGKFILSKARWILTKEDVKDCDKKSDSELLKKILEIRRVKNIPEYILLSQGDNELMLHLENIFCVRLLLNEINKTNTVTITETLDAPDQCWIQSAEGRYAGEFIFSFSLQKEGLKNQLTDFSERQIQQKIRRVFPVGSEWLYAKIYCGTKTAEKLLVNLLKPFTDALLSEEIIDKFFFIRYHDTANHIRIRFHNSVKEEFWKEVISRLQTILEPYFENHLVHNLQFETYVREVERYGSDTMDLSENVFMHHSKTILNFISLLEGDDGEQYRWQVALKAIDFILDDFSYTPEQKRNLVKALNKNFSEEFKIDSAARRKISERFSEHKQVINTLMSDDWMKDENLQKAINVFNIWNKCYKYSINEILNASSVRDNKERLDHLMSSYLHMFINRMFISNQRKTELVIYEYLWKYYDSKLIREKNEKNISETTNAAR